MPQSWAHRQRFAVWESRWRKRWGGRTGALRARGHVPLEVRRGKARAHQTMTVGTGVAVFLGCPGAKFLKPFLASKLKPKVASKICGSGRFLKPVFGFKIEAKIGFSFGAKFGFISWGIYVILRVFLEGAIFEAIFCFSE
jgi:hypothetical protein